jgi:hypothetical protein
MAESDVLINNGALYGLAGARCSSDRSSSQHARTSRSNRVSMADRFAASLQGDLSRERRRGGVHPVADAGGVSIWGRDVPALQGYLGLA